MINYSVGPRINPKDKEAAPLYHANAQCTKVMDMDEFSKHIASHGCVYKRHDIQAVLTMAVDCLREMLLNGYKVQLGDLGAFYVSLTSQGTPTANDFNPVHHVKSVNVNWEAGVDFENLKEAAEFKLVAIRSVQKKGLKAVKNGETVINLIDDPENTETQTTQTEDENQ